MKILILTILVLLCISCKAPQYTIGMNETDFLKHNRVEVVKQTPQISIYKKVNYPFGTAPITKFFYFQNGKLIQVDEGERAPDYNLKISH
jgi:hypothetical protein